MSAIIEQWRKRIDELDAQIVALLNQRAQFALHIGQEKQKKKQSVYSPEREREVFQHVIAANKGPLDDHAIQMIFRVIIEETRRLEERHA